MKTTTKRLFAALALLLAFALVFTACGGEQSSGGSEDDKDGNTDSGNTAATTLTEEEWLNAFDLTLFPSFTVTVDEKYKEPADFFGELIYTFSYN